MGILARFIKPRVDAAVRSALAVVENENTFLIGTRSGTQGDRDRYTYDRSEVLEQSLTAWRTNPLARRIIERPHNMWSAAGRASTVSMNRLRLSCASSGSTASTAWIPEL